MCSRSSEQVTRRELCIDLPLPGELAQRDLLGGGLERDGCGGCVPVCRDRSDRVLLDSGVRLAVVEDRSRVAEGLRLREGLRREARAEGFLVASSKRLMNLCALAFTWATLPASECGAGGTVDGGASPESFTILWSSGAVPEIVKIKSPRTKGFVSSLLREITAARTAGSPVWNTAAYSRWPSGESSTDSPAAAVCVASICSTPSFGV